VSTGPASVAAHARPAVKGRRTEMTATDLLPAHDAVEAAIARVLDAEHAAREAVTQAGETAAEMVEAARGEGRAIAERTERRIRAVRATFEARTAAEVAALDALATDAGVRHELTPDESVRLDAAVAALAARLTQGAG
jgi:hypothetical protein